MNNVVTGDALRGDKVSFFGDFDFVDVADCDGFQDELPSGMDLLSSVTQDDVKAIIREATSRLADSGDDEVVLMPSHPPDRVYQLYAPDTEFTTLLTHYHLVVYSRDGVLWAVQMAVDKVAGRSIESFEFDLEALVEAIDE